MSKATKQMAVVAALKLKIGPARRVIQQETFRGGDYLVFRATLPGGHRRSAAW